MSAAPPLPPARRAAPRAGARVVLAALLLAAGCDAGEGAVPAVTAAELASLEAAFGCVVRAHPASGTVTSALDTADCVLPGAGTRYAEFYAVRLAGDAAGRARARVFMATGGGMDGRVELYTPARVLVAASPPGTTLDALLDEEVAAGLYVFAATSTELGPHLGAFTATLDRALP